MTEQPIAPIRQSSFSDAVTIGALNTKLAEANASLAQWKVSVLADIITVEAGFAVKLNVFKESGQGFIFTINPDEVDYYMNDPSGLVDDIADQAYELLFKQLLRNELAPYVSRGIRNAAQRNAQAKKS